MVQLNEKDYFAKGAIDEINLKDVMTCNEVDFNPGPNLNLILGPNGTGKFTIMSAICLGMNGKPSLILARATTLGSLVRNGAAKTTIDIELHNSDGPNHKITREITAIDNTSTWKYQGKHATKNEINQMIKGLCNLVGNLCQFLLKEQVQNLSRTNDKKRLNNTKSAVGNPQLEEDSVKLKKMQNDFGRVATSSTSKLRTRDFGFHSFLRELATDPESVIRYLCGFRIHNNTISDARIYEKFGAIRDQVGGDYHLFFGDNKRIDIYSRYSRDVITQVGDVRSAQLPGQSVDVAALEQRQHSVSEFENLLAEFQRLVYQITAEYTVVSREQEALRQKEFDLGKYVGHHRTIFARFEKKKMQLNNLAGDAMDLIGEERIVKENCSLIVRQMIAALNEHCRDANAALLYDIDEDCEQILYDAQRSSIVAKQHLLATEKEKIQQLKEEKKAVDRVAAAAEAQTTESLELLVPCRVSISTIYYLMKRKPCSTNYPTR